jgi:hypothetical protein
MSLVTVLSFQPSVANNVMFSFQRSRPLLSDNLHSGLVCEPYKSRRAVFNGSVSVWPSHGEGLHPEGRETGLRTGRTP